METKAGGAGAFAQFDLSRVPSPCFVVDEAAIARNLAVLADVGHRGGAQVLLALVEQMHKPANGQVTLMDFLDFCFEKVFWGNFLDAYRRQDIDQRELAVTTAYPECAC